MTELYTSQVKYISFRHESNVCLSETLDKLRNGKSFPFFETFIHRYSLTINQMSSLNPFIK